MEDPIDVQLLDKFLDFVSDFETAGQQHIWSRHAFHYAYSVDPSVEWIDKRCTMRAIKCVKILALWFYNVEWSGIDINDHVLASLVSDTKRDLNGADFNIKQVFQGGDLADRLPDSLYYIARLCRDTKGFSEKLEKLPHAVDRKVFDEFTESVMQCIMDVYKHHYSAVQVYLQVLFPIQGCQDVVESFLNLLQTAQLKVRFPDYILHDFLKIDPAQLETLFNLLQKTQPKVRFLDYILHDCLKIDPAPVETLFNLLQKTQPKVRFLDYILHDFLKIDPAPVETLFNLLQTTQPKVRFLDYILHDFLKIDPASVETLFHLLKTTQPKVRFLDYILHDFLKIDPAPVETLFNLLQKTQPKVRFLDYILHDFLKIDPAPVETLFNLLQTAQPKVRFLDYILHDFLKIDPAPVETLFNLLQTAQPKVRFLDYILHDFLKIDPAPVETLFNLLQTAQLKVRFLDYILHDFLKIDPAPVETLFNLLQTTQPKVRFLDYILHDFLKIDPAPVETLFNLLKTTQPKVRFLDYILHDYLKIDPAPLETLFNLLQKTQPKVRFLDYILYDFLKIDPAPVETLFNLLQTTQPKVRFLDYILHDFLKIDPAPVETLTNLLQTAQPKVRFLDYILRDFLKIDPAPVESLLNLLQTAQPKVRLLDYIMHDFLKIDPAPVETLFKLVDQILSSLNSPHHHNLMLKLRLIKAQLLGMATITSFRTIEEALTFLTDQFFKTPSMHMTGREKLLLQLIPSILKEASASLCDSSQVSEDVILESSLAIFKLYKAESLILSFTNKSHVDDVTDKLHERSTFRDLFSGGIFKAGQNDQTVQLPSQLSSETELNLEESIAVYEQASWSLFNDFIISDRVVYAPYHLFGKLRRLLTNKPRTFSVMTDHILTLLGEIEFLGSILTDVNNKGAGLRVLCVIYEVEYIVDMFLRGDSPAWYQQLLIFNALDDIKLIKAKIIDMGSFELASVLTTTDDQAKNIEDLLHYESKHPETVYHFLKEFEDGAAREYWRNYVYGNYVLNPSVHWIDEESTLRATTFLKTVQFFYNTKHGGIDEDEQLAAQCQRRRIYLKWLLYEHNVCEEDPRHLASALSESFGAVGLLRVKFADTCNQLMKVPVPARFSDGDIFSDMFGDLVDSVQWYLTKRHYKVIAPVLEQYRYLVCRFSNTCTDQKRLQSLLPSAVTVVSTILQMAFRNETYTAGKMEDNLFSSALDMSKQPSPKPFLNLLQTAQQHARPIGTIMDLIANEPDDDSEEEVAKERLIFELILSFLRDTASLELDFSTPTGTLEDGNVSASCATLATSVVMNEMPCPTEIELYFEDIEAVYLWVFNNSPRNDGVFFTQHLLEKMRLCATKMPDTNVFMKDQFHAFLKNMGFLASFLNDSKNKDLGLCVRLFLYVTEYIIDMLIHGDSPKCYHQLVLFIAIREVELIKVHCSNDKENSELQLKDDQLTLYTGTSRSNGGNLKTEEVVVGFDDHAKNIVELLETRSKDLQVFSIVGMAGIGKTTLAKKVYNIFLSEGRFAVCAGSSVSQVYRKRELLLEILADFSVVTDDVNRMDDDDLALKVYQSLKGKRFLILLDDIWRIEHWDDLKLSFPDDKKGSRILFTTRVRSVAEEANSTNSTIKPYFLPLLSLEQSWDLLQEKVFHGGKCPEKLHEVGRLVAEHCKGLPLAIVVIGGILEKMQDQKNEWETIAAHLRSRVTDNEDAQIMRILELSYNHLPSYLKPCFLYLSSFLEDQEIPVKKLQWLWMGEGFIQKMDFRSLEETSGDYLEELIDRSLIMESKRCSLGGIRTCRIHDMLRELCLKKAKEENFMQLICMDGSNESEFPTDMQYRVSVHSPKQNFIRIQCAASHIHSLLFFATDNSHDSKSYETSSIFQDFKLLRVLDLEPIKASIFPGGLDLLLCLNYLAIKGNIKSIPETIAKLWSLETLIVKGISGEVAVPTTLWSMASLRNVHIRPRASLSISKPELENAMAVENLTTFSSPVFSDKNVAEKILKRWIGLRKLRCVFKEMTDASGECNEFPAMEFLTRLESVNIYYSGKIFPCKFSFPLNLKKLTLSRFCMPWDYMNEVSKLQHLEVLKLLFKAFEGDVWDMSEEIFPKLRVLVMENLNLSYWNASDCSDSFPELERVVLRSCKRLEEVPSSLGDVPTLKQIEVQWCSWSASYSVQPIYEQQVEYANPTFEVAITPSEWNVRR